MTGILPIAKPMNITSRAVSTTIKKLFNTKTGHSGTLDPLATGVLPILIGTSTKLSPYMPSDKSYTATIKLGILTDTGDITGTVLEQKPIANVTLGEITAVLNSFLGISSQIPPMYSALKHNGKNLYSLAREGITIPREPREIELTKIELLSFENDEITFAVSCKKGTYIRTLCEDIAKKLGNLGTMQSLIRTNSCGISLSNCIDYDTVLENSDLKNNGIKNSDLENTVYEKSGLKNSDLENTVIKKDAKEVSKYIISPEQYLDFMPKVTLPDNALNYYKNGGFISLSRITEEIIKNARAYATNGDFIGIAEVFTQNEEQGIKSVWAEENV
ncbi:MAG: tRNA pseudouridine(55) synthase TruB [Clostridia bacterium]